MSAVDIDAAADELLAASRTGKTLPPLTSAYPGLTVDEAYAIQQRQTVTRTGAGAGIVGFKIGLTSAAMQQQLGVDQPDHGHLFTDMLHAADTPILASAFLQPRAEPEIALAASCGATAASSTRGRARRSWARRCWPPRGWPTRSPPAGWSSPPGT